MIASILDKLKNIPGFTATQQHVALLKEFVGERDSRIASLTSELAAANNTIAELQKQLRSLSPPTFHKVRGLFWLPEGDHYEPNPYCPKCQEVMSQFPPGAQLHWCCSSCDAMFDWCPPPPLPTSNP